MSAVYKEHKIKYKPKLTTKAVKQQTTNERFNRFDSQIVALEYACSPNNELGVCSALLFILTSL